MGLFVNEHTDPAFKGASKIYYNIDQLTTTENTITDIP